MSSHELLVSQSGKSQHHFNALNHRQCSGPYISQQKAVKVTDVHLLCYSKFSGASYTYVNNHYVVNTAITKGPINPETNVSGLMM
jgi:hypothetical protein